jgi:hypothetical protein
MSLPFMVAVLNLQITVKLVFNVDCFLVPMIRQEGNGKDKKNGIKKGLELSIF